MKKATPSNSQSINDPRAFGARVRYLRLAAGLSQEELAYVSELDRTYVGGIERGERNPSLKNILRLAAALKVPPDSLFQGWDVSHKEASK